MTNQEINQQAMNALDKISDFTLRSSNVGELLYLVRPSNIKKFVGELNKHDLVILDSDIIYNLQRDYVITVMFLNELKNVEI